VEITLTPAVPILRMHDVDAARRFYSTTGYPFLNPGIEDGPADGRTMELIDPSSNRLRFFERPVTA
jgi:Glyoxalase superfamily protein